MTAFKDRLKELRAAKGLSQRALADQIHISSSSIGMYESGQRQPDFETLEKIAVYETYDYRTKSWYWWTGRDKSTNCFEIRKCGNKFNLIVNESFNSDYKKLESAFEAMKSMYDNGNKEKKFRVLRK